MYPPPNTYNTDYHGASPAPPPTAQPGYGNNPPSFQYGQPTATYTHGPANYTNNSANYSHGPTNYTHGVANYNTGMANSAPPPHGPPLVNTQPNIRVVPQPTYKDYLGLSIMNLLLCCLPIGIVALIYSCKTQDSLRRADMVAASSDSRTAFTLNMVALGLGIVLNISWIGWAIYYGVMLSKISYSASDNSNSIYYG